MADGRTALQENATALQEQRANSFHEAAARKRQLRREAQLLAKSQEAAARASPIPDIPEDRRIEHSLPTASGAPAIPDILEDREIEHCLGLPKESDSEVAEPSSILESAIVTLRPPLEISPFFTPVSGYMDLAGNSHTGMTPIPESSSKSNHSSAVTPNGDRGNTLHSLSHIRPARSPFEDVSIGEITGRGSFGTVYKAQWDGSAVALKVIQHTNIEARKMSPTFEAALAAALAHPNLVATFKHSIRETSENSLELWIVQEWCGLGSLGDDEIVRTILTTGGFADVAEVCCEIAAAGSYLHSRGIVHGDLSRNNVLLTLGFCRKGFVAKVSDFGMARVLGDKSYIETKSMGTVASMPPELFVSDEVSVLTPKVDVYAFGVILWVLCCGKNPFESMSSCQIVVQVGNGSLKLELPSSVPEAIIQVFERSTVRQPAERADFQSLIPQLLDIRTKEKAGTVGRGDRHKFL